MEVVEYDFDYRIVAINEKMVSPHLIFLFRDEYERCMSRNLIKLEANRRDLFGVLARTWRNQEILIDGHQLSAEKRLCFSCAWPQGLRMSPWEITYSENKVSVCCI